MRTLISFTVAMLVAYLTLEVTKVDLKPLLDPLTPTAFQLTEQNSVNSDANSLQQQLDQNVSRETQITKAGGQSWIEILKIVLAAILSVLGSLGTKATYDKTKAKKTKSR